MKTVLSAIIPLVFGLQSFAGPIIIDYTNTLSVPGTPQSVLNQAAQWKWFFAHASVGGNIMSGLAALHSNNPAFYQLTSQSVTDTPPATISRSIIYEYDRGNPGWGLKVDWFTGFVSNGWRAPKVDIVLNKFCYVDQTANFDYYISTTSALERSNRQTWFVYATIPVMDTEDSDNYLRNVFNDSLRAWTRTNNRILLDIADIEAYDTNGVQQTFVYNGKVCQKLVSSFSADHGHLTASLAQQRAALGLYALGAALAVADRDNDGVPDWWEMAHGMDSLNPNDALSDPDGDGMSNVNEFLSGTDPLSAASVLRLSDFAWAGGSFQFQFTAASNISYTVLMSSAAGIGSWQHLVDISAQPYERAAFIVDSGAVLGTKRFYRVVARRSVTSL